MGQATLEGEARKYERGDNNLEILSLVEIQHRHSTFGMLYRM